MHFCLRFFDFQYFYNKIDYFIHFCLRFFDFQYFYDKFVLNIVIFIIILIKDGMKTVFDEVNELSSSCFIIMD